MSILWNLHSDIPSLGLMPSLRYTSYFDDLGTGIWIPANMLAWAFGMPVIFWGVDMAFKMAAI